MPHRMNKRTVKEFHFNDDGYDLLQSLPPITLSKHPDLVDRIYNRYPLVNKIEIALVVLATFEVMRNLFLSGCIINLHRFFNAFRVHFFQHTEKDTTYPAVKAKLETPALWREKPSWVKRKIKTILSK